MNTKYILEKLTDQYLKNITDITNNFCNIFNELYKLDIDQHKDLEGYFGDLKNEINFQSDIQKIFLEAKKAKENYDTYK